MYKRLTEYDGHVAVTKGRHIDVSMLIDRLAAYEDTEWTPEEIKAVQAAISPISFERYCEIMQAERDGRLVVLPCKVGDAVYEPRKDRGIISEYEITEIIINQYGVSFFRWNLKEGIYSHLGGFPVECLGKTIFLSREAAEKAIAEVVGE